MKNCLEKFNLRRSEPDHLFWQGFGPALDVQIVPVYFDKPKS